MLHASYLRDDNLDVSQRTSFLARHNDPVPYLLTTLRQRTNGTSHFPLPGLNRSNRPKCRETWARRRFSCRKEKKYIRRVIRDYI